MTGTLRRARAMRRVLCPLVFFLGCVTGCGSSGGAATGDDQNDVSTSGDFARLDKLLADLRAQPDDAARAQLVAAFQHDVAYSGGFPIRAEGKVAFVFFDPDRHPGVMSVAGDFNGFDPNAARLDTPIAGFPLYVHVEATTVPKARSRYKLVRDGKQFFADPFARSYTYDDNGEMSLLEPGADKAHLERWPGFADHRGSLDARTLFVYVPPGQAPASGPGLPLLVMHDGQNLFDPAGPSGGWHVADAMSNGIAKGTVRPAIVVGIPNTAARFDEYTHVPDKIEVGTVGGKAKEYSDFVVSGVVPFVRAHYHVRTDAAGTGVLGSSLGGLVSFFIGIQHPETFGFVGSMSGTMGWGSIGAHNPTMLDLYRKDAPKGTSYYVDSGGGDNGACARGEGGDDNFCWNKTLDTELAAEGLADGRNLFYRVAPGAQHNEAEWAKRLPGALQGWFPGPPSK